MGAAITAVDATACTSDIARLLTVQTTNGPITGHAADNSPCVLEYLGIPYAKPPTGDRRFALPERFVGDKPYKTRHWGFDCPLTASPPTSYPGFIPQAQRILNYFASTAGTNRSEDCLTLNIWPKATQPSASGGKPVIVVFYGGHKFVVRKLKLESAHT
ncbi:hypothetical protein VHEMI05863 [[Torrubiella] hemipterigena]|uniref:Carboxylesterase type B domain-containing protein n=1 Tax=[Torrubiella] hemipterigena TaxID=1531966 RepID=A0A0A1T5G9_9HYPO|nr:hypothetical protein VHEMI05863 [[Torrubiella] hemipterigena]